MTYEEFLAVVTNVAQNLSNQGVVTENLTKLSDAYKSLSTNHSSLNEQKTAMEQQINSLKEQNMNLFLRVGQPVNTTKLNENTALSYDDLLSKEFGVEV
ncbi:MAG: hypothetical protein HF308_17130 [Ignavibacteria bacterium]|jgi:acyl-[acyl carrier protein]--UDP-N-acetylglucosamine O-acyltransferase|nr:hypothetical protein [Ignavibacteria bacterium]